MTSCFPVEAADKVLDSAAAAGVEREALLGAAGIPAGAGALTYARLCALYEAGARLTGDAAFGVHVGEAGSHRNYGLLGYVAAHSATFGEALDALIDYQQLWTDAVRLELGRRGSTVSLLYAHGGGVAAEDRRQESEQMLATLICFAREALAGPVGAVEARFEHRAPTDTAEHRRILGGRILFGRRTTELLLPAGLLDRPLPAADERLGALVREQADAKRARRAGAREPLIGLVRQELRLALARGGETGVEALASRLALGPRTLQRRLREQGLTLRLLTEDVRAATARDLLADPALPVAEIAFRLGYSQPSAFHRAFRRTEGTTPRRFRQSLRDPGA